MARNGNKIWIAAALAGFVVVGCGDDGGGGGTDAMTTEDATMGTDAIVDATTDTTTMDATMDATVDATVDATMDATMDSTTDTMMMPDVPDGPPPGSIDIELKRDPDLCTQVEACGGEVDGKWSYTSACAQLDNNTFGTCPMAMVDATGFGTGQLEFDSETMTVIETLDYRVSGVVQVPGDCITTALAGTPFGALGWQMACPLVGDFRSMVPGLDVFDELTCAVAGDRCDCDAVVIQDLSSSAPYQLQGNQIVIDPEAERPRRFDYCVDGTMGEANEIGGSDFKPAHIRAEIETD